MENLTSNQLHRIAVRLRAYAVFLDKFSRDEVELGDYEWDFPFEITAHEIMVQLEELVDEVADA